MAKRWTERHEFYQKALRQLTIGLAAYPDLNELEKDGVIQRFEFTFELAWKTLQDYFAQELGYADVKGPRTVLKQAVKDGLVTDGYSPYLP
jgi:nucleotidyltransferase substrate binding protein (TIGR01987 family)